MIDFLAFIGIGISAFVATNIDDLFILMLFFSSPNFQKGQVVIGQYLGIGMLVIISTVGSLLALACTATSYWIVRFSTNFNRNY